jgi:hypothetical protein
MVMKTIWVPFYNADSTEGRGPMVPKSFGFDAEIEALNYINTQPGIMGRRAPGGHWSQHMNDWVIRPIQVLSSASEVMDVERENLKNQALNKLTQAEREALGL